MFGEKTFKEAKINGKIMEYDFCADSKDGYKDIKNDLVVGHLNGGRLWN